MGGISFFPQKNTRNLLMDCSKTVNLAPSNQFLELLFPSYSRFKKKSPTCQKVFPHPTVGAPSASYSPRALRQNEYLLYDIDAINIQQQ